MFTQEQIEQLKKIAIEQKIELFKIVLETALDTMGKISSEKGMKSCAEKVEDYARLFTEI